MKGTLNFSPNRHFSASNFNPLFFPQRKYAAMHIPIIIAGTAFPITRPIYLSSENQVVIRNIYIAVVDTAFTNETAK